ncbi:hypothetical protein [Citrobacter pasteurii]|nr:hypothetical protein SF123566_8558 [Shigella flexneri 1235-66]CEJ64376.1 hypothetical protein [Citrobacter pasteurii]
MILSAHAHQITQVTAKQNEISSTFVGNLIVIHPFHILGKKKSR